MIKSQNIDLLISSFTDKLREMGYAEESIKKKIRWLRRGVRLFLTERGESEYTRSIGLEWLQSIEARTSSYKFATYVRLITSLNDFLETGEFKPTYRKENTLELNGVHSEFFNSFLQHLQSERKANATINNHRRILKYYGDFLVSKGIEKIESASIELILEFIGNAQLSGELNRNTLRVFYKYLNDKEIFKNNFCEFIPSCTKKYISSKLPSAYTADEIKAIEQSIDRNCDLGIRDYALLLVTTRLGLRVSDVASLKFKDIDWDKNIITIVQYKTKRKTELPLLREVGDAIVDYAKVRPISKLANVFLSFRPPYRALLSQTVSMIIRKIIASSGVDIRYRKSGPHALRHSLASRMLENEVSLPVISESLGHSRTQSTMNYLRIDIPSLLKCSLNVPLVNNDFYRQKGDVFYDKF